MTAPEIVLPVLFTDEDGRARWREQAVSLRADSPQVWLSALAAASGVQWRESPVGFASGFHCTTQPQWLVVLQGVMEIGLRDGSWRRFGPGECFYSGDTLPPGAKAAASRCARCSCAGRWRDEGCFRSLIDSARS